MLDAFRRASARSMTVVMPYYGYARQDKKIKPREPITARLVADLITAAGDHPITANLTPFHVTDETYKGLFISPKIKPLLFTDNATSDRTVAWIGPCTTSRVVFIQLGHDHLPFRHPAYRAFVHNSILWTAGQLK